MENDASKTKGRKITLGDDLTKEPNKMIFISKGWLQKVAKCMISMKWK